MKNKKECGKPTKNGELCKLPGNGDAGCSKHWLKSTSHHTPTPWQVVNAMDIATVNDRRWLMSADNEADAAYIVKAVNCHQEFVWATKMILSRWESRDLASAVNKLREVMEKAEGRNI